MDNNDPLGFPHGDGGIPSYQIVVHQALMHTPIFVRWILSHNEPRQPDHGALHCIMCAYKRLAHLYWARPSPPNRLIPFHNMDVQLIAQAAIYDDHAVFGHGEGDAGEFYGWLVNMLKFPDPADRVFPPAEWREEQWNEEHQAVFNMQLKERNECLTCQHTEVMIVDMDTINVNVAHTDMDLDQILAARLWNQHVVENCVNCGIQTNHLYQRQITAAPQVLIIRVNLLFAIQNSAVIMKVLTGWDVPDNLNLMAEQSNGSLPLDYSLTSAIAHGGDGGYATIDQHANLGGAITAEEIAELTATDDEEQADDEAAADEDANNNGDNGLENDGNVENPEDLSDEEEEPFHYQRDYVSAGATRRSPSPARQGRYRFDNMADYNGLVEVDEQEYIDELGPDLDDLPDFEDQLYEEEEDEEMVEESDALNMSEGSSSPLDEHQNEGGLDLDADDQEYDSDDVDFLIDNMEVSDENPEFNADNLEFEDDIQDLNADDAENYANSSDSEAGDALPDNDNPHPNHDVNSEHSSNDAGMDDLDEELSSEDDGRPGLRRGHYVANVIGPGPNTWHVAENHSWTIPPNSVNRNPQQPPLGCGCTIVPAGHQVVVLTYTRQSLTGKPAKDERNIPPF